MIGETVLVAGGMPLRAGILLHQIQDVIGEQEELGMTARICSSWVNVKQCTVCAGLKYRTLSMFPQ
jgi:hypothetical protein